MSRPANRSSHATEEGPALLSNVEVFHILQKRMLTKQRLSAEEEEKFRTNGKNSNKKKKPISTVYKKIFQHRDWVESEVVQYLESTPCMQLVDDQADTNNNADAADADANANANAKTQDDHETKQQQMKNQKRYLELLQILQNNKKQRKNNNNSFFDNSNNSTLPTEMDDTGTPTSTTSNRTAFGLTDTEAMQILNLMPTELVEIHLLIEDLHSRIPDEKQQEELLEIIASFRKQNDSSLENKEADDNNEEETNTTVNNDNEEEYHEGEYNNDDDEEQEYDEGAMTGEGQDEVTHPQVVVKTETEGQDDKISHPKIAVKTEE